MSAIHRDLGLNLYITIHIYVYILSVSSLLNDTGADSEVAIGILVGLGLLMFDVYSICFCERVFTCTSSYSIYVSVLCTSANTVVCDVVQKS